MTLSEYQLQRKNDVQQWYVNVYHPLDGHAPESIRYMALWAVFNALYNIADFPKIILRGVHVDDGIIKPNIRGRDEDKKLRFISRCFVGDDQFTNEFFQENREFIEYLSSRTPKVQQPPGINVIQYEYNGQEYTFDLTNLHGIASLDQRIFLPDGAVLFQYHQLDLDLDENNLPKNPQKFYQQLIFMLYQLRNNIVHGGSAAFFMYKNELSVGAIRLLESLIQYLFDHPERLQQMEV